MSHPCFHLTEVAFAVHGRTIIKGVSQAIQKGAFYGLLGPNGCGKTTLLDLMIGHKQLDSGEIVFMGERLATISKNRLARRIAMVSQNFYINFPYTVLDVVMMGRYPHLGRFTSPRAVDRQVVQAALEITGTERFKHHLVTELSGGERQRTIFARALAQNTDVLLLDEATSNLDISHTLALLDIVKKRVQQKGITVMAVFQDINLAAMYCDELIFMQTGQIAATGPTQDMMEAQLLETVFQVQAKIRYEALYQTKQAVFKAGGVP